MIADDLQATVSDVLFLDMNKGLRFNISLTQVSWMGLLLKNMCQFLRVLCLMSWQI
jgi:hypothetical protein